MRAPRPVLQLWLAFVLLLFGMAALRTIAWGAPPAGLEAIGAAAAQDDRTLELTNIRGRLITGNLRSLQANIDALDRAEGEAFVATFEWYDDLAGRAIADAAIRAARRGVRVVAVVDGAKVFRAGRRRLLAAMKREGVDVRLYHPLHSSGYKAFYRMHEKALIVRLPDGRYLALFGGRNKTNHYLLGHDVIDVDTLLTIDGEQGRKLLQLQQGELLADEGTMPWDGVTGYGWTEHQLELIEMTKATDAARGLFALELKGPGPADVPVSWALFARNRPGRPTATRLAEAAIANARKSVALANAYLVPEERLLKIFAKKLEEKVQIAAFSNSFESTVHGNVVRLMAGALKGLLSKKLVLFLRKQGEVHAKATVVDGRVLLVTSVNFDGRSEWHDTQNGILLDSPELANQLLDDLAAQLVRGEYHVVENGRVPGFNALDVCVRALISPLKRIF